jgi:hypothetical protein
VQLGDWQGRCSQGGQCGQCGQGDQGASVASVASVTRVASAASVTNVTRVASVARLASVARVASVASVRQQLTAGGTRQQFVTCRLGLRLVSSVTFDLLFCVTHSPWVAICS